MFNKDCKLRKYKNVQEIIDEFYDVRLETYSRRKKQLIKELEEKLVKLSNRAKYILATLDGKVDLRRKNAATVHQLLVDQGFDLIDGDFKYLIKMPMDSVTQENVEKILKEKDEADEELRVLRKTSPETMWLKELKHLEKEYENYQKKRQNIQNGTVSTTKVTKKRKLKK